MYIKVIACQDSRFWYNSHIGNKFEVTKIESDRVWVIAPATNLWKYNTLNFVLNCDYVVLDDYD